MKKAKKLVSLLLAVVMLLSLAVSVGAVEDTTTPTPITVPVEDSKTEGPAGSVDTKRGSITIENAKPGEMYTLYQILYLDQYTDDFTNVAYKSTSGWKSFIEGSTVDGVYLETDANGYIKSLMDNNNKGPVQQFAQMALAYAKANTGTVPVVATTTVPADNKADTSVTFSNLKFGYYLIDTTVGSVCTLDTTKPNVTVRDKNGTPTVTKEVQENNNWGSTNDAAVGDIVNYRSELNIYFGTDNLKFHDTMDQGLTFNNSGDNKPKITLREATLSEDDAQQLTEGVDYKIETSCTDNCTFEIVFKDNFYKTINKVDGTKFTRNWKVKIEYSAVLTGDQENKPGEYDNKCHLTYGDNNRWSNEPSTKTKTWELPVYKYTDATGSETGLAGAQFRLTERGPKKTDPASPEKEGRSEYTEYDVYVKQVSAGDDNTPAIYVTSDAANGEKTITTNGSGKFVIKGMDSGTYYLFEDVAPGGYNALKEPLTITIQQEDGSILHGFGTVSEVKVLNTKGAVMPSTGGIGTTIFYVVGSILLVGATILLIVKKRMNDEK